jgi:hypothetical protein
MSTPAEVQQLHDRGVVGDDQTIKAPPPAQQIRQQFAMRGARNARQIVKPDHDGAGAGIDRRFKGRQDNVVHAIRADIDGIVVTARLHQTVAGEVLGSCHYCIGSRQIFVLKALDHGNAEYRAEQRIFARAFRTTPPASVTGHVEHRRPRQRDAISRSFSGSSTRGSANQSGLPRARKTQRERKDRTVTVYDIEGEQQRDSLRRLFDRNSLQLIQSAKLKSG